MSAKRAKRLRREARYLYYARMVEWIRKEPPWWKFIKRRKWKKAKPVKPKGCK